MYLYVLFGKFNSFFSISKYCTDFSKLTTPFGMPALLLFLAAVMVKLGGKFLVPTGKTQLYIGDRLFLVSQSKEHLEVLKY